MEDKKIFDISQDAGVLYLDPEVYPLETIYKAAYVMIDKAFILLDKDGQKIKVQVNRKNGSQNIRQLVEEFNEELLNYVVYKTQNDKNKVLRELILQKVMITNDPNYYNTLNTATDNIQKPKEDIEDPEEIFKPWEEKNA
ncbi:His-Xaa-Ser system protein HxsD [Nanoarchaeota archaeon]